MDYSIRIGGEAGQGIQTVGDTLSKVFARAGYHVFTLQDYESRIRGGHNFYEIRIADRPLTSSSGRIDILVAFDRDSIAKESGQMTERGRILYDPEALKERFESPACLAIPFASLAVQHGGSGIMANTVATGAVLGLLGIELSLLHDLIRETFSHKGEAVVAANLAASAAGFEEAGQQCADCSFPPGARSAGKLLLSAVDAIGVGAVASDCRFYAAYPMTPSTGIMNYMAAKAGQYGLVVEQAEDEIAAVNMAIGASYAGVRAMTASSGGGFALMVEGLALAAMTETPIVIGLGQRPGPATGLPTRTEQAELQFVLHAGHGEFPRIVLAPGDPEQALRLTHKAFDLAEKYQVPAFILFDQYLADSQWTYDSLPLNGLVHTDYRLRGERLTGLDEYRRHGFSDSGVSPLAVPGESTHLVATDSDEHTEEGHITEDPEIRIMMVRKRVMKKLPLLRDEMAPPLFYGAENPELLLLGWGSTYGIIKEAVERLAPFRRAAMLHFSEIFPFPGTDGFDYLSLLRGAGRTICIEQNATSQFGRLLRAETGFVCSDLINRYDGRPFTAGELLGRIDALIQ